MTTHDDTIANAKEAIKVLGGVDAVADWLGITQEAVQMMRHRGHVARGYHLHFYITLKNRGFDVKPELFGLASFERLVMPRRRKRGTALPREAVA